MKHRDTKSIVEAQSRASPSSLLRLGTIFVVRRSFCEASRRRLQSLAILLVFSEALVICKCLILACSVRVAKADKLWLWLSVDRAKSIRSSAFTASTNTFCEKFNH
ncbi:uncharacterized protein G2W53_026821 [Senna tora]|uniref:Uncharacterized protein n=1 Tax=Senna tora TaxID=362788 RepID=A0A834TI13_9FABA|nr:uncharacterized protein G2W53_026821 [Senna tora]